MKNLPGILIIFFLLVFAACAKKATPTQSTTEPPKAKATSFVADVQPLIQMKCAPCHLPSKGGNKASFETYAGAQKFAADMVARIERNPGDRGFMPFKQPKLSTDEIAVFKKWVSDGSVEK